MTLRLALEIGGDATGARQALGDTVGAINQLTAAEARMNPKVHAERARDIGAFGAELDRLRAKYNPIFALSKQYENEINEISRAHRVGAISTREQAGAIDHLNAQFQAMAVATSTAGTATAATTMQGRQLMFQMVDIGQTIPLAMQSPIYALQNVGFQVAQIGQLYYGQGGMQAALRDMTSMAGRFVSAIGPWPLAIGAAAAAGALFFSSISSGANEADAALERHEDLIGKIRDAWPEAAEGMRKYAGESREVLLSLQRDNIADLTATLREGARDLLLDGEFFMPDFPGMIQPRADAFRRPLEALFESIKAGEPEIEKFRRSVAAMINDDSLPDHVREMGRELRDLTADLGEVERKMREAEGATGALGGEMLAQRRAVEEFGDAFRALSGIALPRLDDRAQAADHLGRGLLAAREFDDIAERRSAAQSALTEYEAALGRIDAEEQRVADKRAAREAKADARKAERRTDRFFGGMDQLRGEIEAMRVEAATFGLAEDAAARYRVEQEQIAAAHQAGVPLTNDLRSSIAGLADEYGAATADLARLADEQQRLDDHRDVARGFFQDMRSGLQDGASVADNFANAIGRVADRLSELALDQSLACLIGEAGTLKMQGNPS